MNPSNYQCHRCLRIVVVVVVVVVEVRVRNAIYTTVNPTSPDAGRGGHQEPQGRALEPDSQHLG